jgi:deoxycytidine triphosphate deaminase
MQQIHSKIDIKKNIKKRRIKIDPSPKSFGPASIDLDIESVWKVEEKQRLPSIIELYKEIIENFFRPFGRSRDLVSPTPLRLPSEIPSLFIESTTLDREREIENPNLGKPLRVEPIELESDRIYIVKYRQRVTCDEEIRRQVTRRSRWARCGIFSGGVFYNKGEIYEIITSECNVLIYPHEEKISQMFFTSNLDIDEHSYWENKLEDKIVVRKNGKRLKIQEIPWRGFGFVLSLDNEVKFFTGSKIDRRHFQPEDFIPGYLKQSPPRNYKFLLGKTNEVIKIGPSYIGRLYPLATHVFDSELVLNIHFNAPYTLPGSNNNLVLEISSESYRRFMEYAMMADRSVLKPSDIRMFLRILPIKTPGPVYSGKFRNHSSIMLPWKAGYNKP